MQESYLIVWIGDIKLSERDWGGVIVGFGWLLNNIYGFNFWAYIGAYWPVIFIIIGLSIIAKHYNS